MVDRMVLTAWRALKGLRSVERITCRTSQADKFSAPYHRSLATWEQPLGAGHPHVATNLNNLVGLYELMGCYGEAEPRYARCLESVV